MPGWRGGGSDGVSALNVIQPSACCSIRHAALLPCKCPPFNLLYNRPTPPSKVHRVEYRGRMEAADAFFSQPWLMEVPPGVGDTCWDVILVDAPQGYEPQGQPGAL